MYRTLSSLVFIALIAVFAAPLQAKTCEAEIGSNDQIEYSKEEIRVSADCDTLKLTLTHDGEMPVEQMGHNWTLAKTADWRALAQEGQAAGLENDYLPVDDDRIIANTDMIGGGETASVTVDLSELDADGDYTFFCSFPGHWALMNGKLIIE